MGAPPTSSHPATGPCLAWQAWVWKPTQRPSPQLPLWLGHQCLQLGKRLGSPEDHVQEVLESMHQLVPVPSKNTHGSLGFPEFGVTAAQTDD